jgi:copper(I)-binding protein
MFRAIRSQVPATLLAALAGLLAMPAVADIVATEGWARATVPGTKVAAGYLVLTNTGDKERALLRIESPLCDIVRIHISSVDNLGVSRMWPVGKLELKPGEVVRFTPNGLHVMLEDIKAPFVAGQKIPLKLQFDGGEPEITVQLEVRALVPAAKKPEPGAGQHENP